MKRILDFAKENWIFMLFLGLAFLMWFVVIFNEGKCADERPYYRQISRFTKGNYEMLPDITTFPGYHACVALIADPFVKADFINFRVISLFLSLTSLWAFYLISKNFGIQNLTIRTLQFLFLPISFVYFPLIYTDIFALSLVLFAFYFTIKKKYGFSALFSLFSILVRQLNILWVLFIWVYGYVSSYGLKISWQKIYSYIRNTIWHIAIFIAFAMFVWFNGGIALGDKTNHQLGFYMGNIYFFLALVGVLFLPILVSTVYKFRISQLKRPVIFGLVASVSAASLFVIFQPDLHPNNYRANFFRNVILLYTYSQHVWPYALAIFLGCATLFLMKFEKTIFLALPFIVLCLSQSFLIEQRYSIVPITLLLLLRKESDRKTEFALVLYFFALSLGLVLMLLKTRFFF